VTGGGAGEKTYRWKLTTKGKKKKRKILTTPQLVGTKQPEVHKKRRKGVGEAEPLGHLLNQKTKGSSIPGRKENPTRQHSSNILGKRGSSEGVFAKRVVSI